MNPKNNLDAVKLPDPARWIVCPTCNGHLYTVRLTAYGREIESLCWRCRGMGQVLSGGAEL
jgi:hypothetical protein